MESNIVNSEAARLAYAIAGYSHKPVEQVVMTAMRELATRVLPNEETTALTRLGKTDLMAPIFDWREADDILYDEFGLPKSDKPLKERIMDIRRHCATLPILDNRSAEEILGYTENGLLP
jgi:hypothetical protein